MFKVSRYEMGVLSHPIRSDLPDWSAWSDTPVGAPSDQLGLAYVTFHNTCVCYEGLRLPLFMDMACGWFYCLPKLLLHHQKQSLP